MKENNRKIVEEILKKVEKARFKSCSWREHKELSKVSCKADDPFCESCKSFFKVIKIIKRVSK